MEIAAKVTIIAIGKIKNSLEEPIINHYAKQMHNLKIIELESKQKNSQIEIKLDEAQRIRNNIPKSSFLIALEVDGKQMTSHSFSKVIAEYSNICFIIGGAYGLDKNLSDSADMKISLSAMTFPHKFARIMLVEQIYRAGAIIHNHPYSK
jgi:23S rRNA (pseudouridine1915-N3)-methyltransferase